MNCPMLSQENVAVSPLISSAPNFEVTPEKPFQVNLPRKDAPIRTDQFTLFIDWSLDEFTPVGTILTMGNLSYGVDPVSLKPFVKIGNQTYRSENMLCTSDAWKTGASGTDGKSYMTKMGQFTTAIHYNPDTRLLTIYRNGLIDQRFEAEGLKLDDITIQGFTGRVARISVYDSPLGINLH